MELKITVTEKRLNLGRSNKNGDKFDITKTFDVLAVPTFPNGEKEHANYKVFGENPSGEIRFANLPSTTAAQFEVGREYTVSITPVEVV